MKKKVSVFNIVNAAVLLLFAFLCVFPFVYEILISFSSKADFAQSKFIVIPRHFTFENYKFIFIQNNIYISFLISMLITAVGVLFCMTLTVIGAYALSRRDLFLGKAFFGFVLFTMFFGG